MKQRNPLAVFALSLVTLGIYTWYWLVKTKGEMNRTANTNIMTAWIWLIPFIGWLWWLWQYSTGVDKVTNGKLNSALAFIILFLIPAGISEAIVQHMFNETQAAGPSQQPPEPSDDSSSADQAS